ncbi:MAG: YidC/Oxa1 family rane protein insertase [Actinomycetota bacterium]|jgi:YidC/Oxa1 family membrane protein insertase|nr:YidC/Oxa1 family rane protein insertase [Actinomycetota bacterium]
MFDPLFHALAWLLSFFYSLVPNYAVAIALLTLTVMLLLFPLNAKGMRSMAAMSKLSPELKRIQAKYKNDKVKQNEEVMALFKEHNVTPFGGCLPLLLQMPVLFIMYHVIRGLTHVDAAGRFDPKYVDHASKLYQDLHGKREMLSFGIDLAKSARQVLQVSYVSAIPFLILIAGVVATGYYQQRMISRRNPAQAGDDNPMAKQMQQLTKIYPLMYLVFGFTLPAALNVYFLVSSGFRIVQQALIYKMDPSLLPGTGAATVSSREVSTSATASPSTNGKNGKKPAAATAEAAPPARVANRPAANKKKKRR